MKVEVSNGELVDKVTILELKLSNITDIEKLINIQKEFNELNPLLEELFTNYSPDLQNYYLELANINSQLWEIEDDIRECERKAQFDNIFVELARSVYITNDRRCEVKKMINILTNSGFVEEKSYEEY
jgi:hypothetical protein|tara:strand:+ start:1712 stop:2095 length:384 start_codon:yes stop_codon:yes gene_type:complete